MSQHPHVVHWNPVRPRFPGRIGRRLPFKRPVNNFGDLVGPVVVESELRSRGLAGVEGRHVNLLTVGSILHFAGDGDVVWGSGVNGKVPESAHTFRDLDVRAVRGPRTRAFLQTRGIDVPAVFGDPALLLPHQRPDLVALRERPVHDLTVVPNLNDLADWKDDPDLLDPRSPLEECLRRIVTSRLVIGSSLHGAVIAEAFGVPARIVVSNAESPFKYQDYFAGTGREDPVLARTRAEALSMGGHPPQAWDPAPLLETFPEDLWVASGRS